MSNQKVFEIALIILSLVLAVATAIYEVEPLQEITDAIE